jgi:glycine dehydrogenase
MSNIMDTSGEFIPRHIGPSEADQQRMLAAIESPTLEALMQEVVPANIRMTRELNLPAPRAEADVLAEMKKIAECKRQNRLVHIDAQFGQYRTRSTPNAVVYPRWLQRMSMQTFIKSVIALGVGFVDVLCEQCRCGDFSVLV